MTKARKRVGSDITLQDEDALHEVDAHFAQLLQRCYLASQARAKMALGDRDDLKRHKLDCHHADAKDAMVKFFEDLD